MPHEKEILDEDIFVKELDKRRQAKIEETVLNFLRKRRSVDGNGYKIGKISKETGLSVHSVSLVLKMSLLYKKWVEWVEYDGVDYFRATSKAS
jgi:hypothetical protein